MIGDQPTMEIIQKADCFRFLAACFYYPKKEIIADQVLPSLIANLRQVCPAAVSFSEQMAQALASYSDEDLAVEYAALFVGPFALKAPPYGSIYLDGERTVMGPSTMQTIRCYEQEGLVRDESFTELPDHIAVELEFMYYLIYKEAESLKKGEPKLARDYRRKQTEFSSGLLGRWAPEFCRNIKEGTDNKFYAALADCLCSVIGVQGP